MKSYDELFKLHEEFQEYKERELENLINGTTGVSGSAGKELIYIMLYMISKKNNEITEEIIHQASKSFAKQYTESKEVRECTHIVLFALTIMMEFIDKINGVKTKRLTAPCRRKLESRWKLRRYLENVKVFIMTEGAQKLSKYPWVTNLKISRRRSKIELDITTANLFELFKKIHAGLKCEDEFPYRSVPSLGQVIRHHRDSLEREGFKILTERRGSTHLLITYSLTKKDLWCIRNRKQWIEENKPKKTK